ncbi:rap guanine nucleotide exchange factor 2-like isoform X3 [Patiria miniata]|uniref:Rap guanine nucleotide exchange factor 2 n=1 Tax=Patiria miniata TaxID=46514 RepID=A0A914AA33_PATMI|nr:rap guanine nucleotide exchange factor 2-like isoform X3 [Patiria miniata]
MRTSCSLYSNYRERPVCELSSVFAGADANIMSAYVDQHYIKCLQRTREERSQQNLDYIISFLHTLEALRSLREPALREIAKNVRYIKKEANDILYCRDDRSTCWYILLSGSVFIDQAMFLPRSSFGKRTSGSGRRGADCLILEASELLVIDYPDAHLMKPGQRQSYTPTNLERLMALEQEEVQVPAVRGRSFSEDRSISFSSDSNVTALPSIRLERTQSLDSEKKHSKKTMEDIPTLLSDMDDTTSVGHHHHLPVMAPSACYSDRSSIHSSMSSSFSDLYQAGSCNENPDLDLTGLVESTVDSDDEDTVSESASTLVVRDFVRDCLEKDPMDRTEDDIEILLDFMRHLPAFANMTMSVRRALCAVMVFAVVAKAGTIVMKNEEELDSWSVILNGHVEVTKSDGSIDQLHLGDSFGVKPTLETQFHVGVMKTTIDDCQFVCIAQDHYYRILTQGEENIRRIEENGQVVMITEHRVLDDRRQGHILIKATPERLILNLMEDSSPVDPTYVEDFLMSYRIYLPSPHQVCDSLLHWFQDVNLRDKVTRVLLLWVNNYYSDFERSPDMIEFLETFEDCLEKETMAGQLRLLHIAGAAKAKPRTVVLARSDRDSKLSFSIVGGWEKKMGIFISKVERGSKAQTVGLRKGDQLLEVNGHSFEHVTRTKALEILKGTTHLSITVKYNTLAFRDLIASQDGAGRSTNWGRLPSQEIQLLQADPRARLTIPDLALAVPLSQMSPEIKAKSKHEKRGGFATLGHKTKLRKAMAKLSILPNKTTARTQDDSSTLMRHSKSGSITGSNPYLSNSNPDLSSIASIPMYESSTYMGGNDYPEHVLKLYRADQSCKYFLVHKETTALEVVMLAMREHGLTEAASSGTYSLCEVTVAPGGMVKQRRLPDHQNDIASRLSLCGRLFLRNNMASETLMPDEVAVELLKDSQVTFLQLDSNEVAAQLTLRDYGIFQEIEATDYIEDLFVLQAKGSNDRLQLFEEIVNNELFWVVTEVCNELNLVKRAKIIKQFVKIARHCKDCKNFNSLFAIISGLGHGCVSRLRSTWDKVPAKYVKMFEDLQDLMDPSRNMSKYRNLVSSEQVQPPLIPFFPVVKKDLTFIHLGNDTKVDGLINFEKLRMVSREVRYIVSMANAAYDPRQLLAPKMTGSGSPLIGSSLASVMGSSVATLPRKRSQGRRSSAVINPKKMWEESQMCRRVKQYLSVLAIVRDEDELRELSLKCEPIANSAIQRITGGGSMNSGQMRRSSQTSQSSLTSTLAPPATTYNKQEEEIKKIIYKDAPKTSFGATSPKNLRKLLSLSEEGESRLSTMKVQKSSHSKGPPSSGQSKVGPASPTSNAISRTRRVAVTNRVSTSSTEGNGGRKLSPQRSDSGYGGSEAGSTTRQEHKPKHRQTAGQQPGMTGPYDSSDSSQSCLSSNYDTQSNSSFGSSSPPIRDHQFPNDLPGGTSVPLNNQLKPRSRWANQDDRPRQPPEYHTATKGTPPKASGRSYSQPPSAAPDMTQRQPPDYAVATARKREMSNSKSEACDFYDSDNEQVSVV